MTDVLQTISVADVMDGLVQVCLLNKRAPGQVELLAEALGENVTGNIYHLLYMCIIYSPVTDCCQSIFELVNLTISFLKTFPQKCFWLLLTNIIGFPDLKFSFERCYR